MAINRSQAWDALHFAGPPQRNRPRRRFKAYKGRQFIAQKDFSELIGNRSGIVLFKIDPVYLNALLSDRFVAAPLDGDHNYQFSHSWHYDRPEALALVKKGLDRALPIYALFTSTGEMTKQQSRLPSPPGYQWTVFNSGAGATILQLAPVIPEERSSP